MVVAADLAHHPPASGRERGQSTDRFRDRGRLTVGEEDAAARHDVAAHVLAGADRDRNRRLQRLDAERGRTGRDRDGRADW